MRMNYTPESIKMGRVNTRKSKETPNSFAMQDGASAVQETAPLDQTSQDRMTGGVGARALQLMNDPAEQARVNRWMGLFNLTVPGAQFNQFNQAKMNGGMPPPPQ